MGWNLTLSKHPAQAAAEIRAGIAQAAGRLGEMKPFTIAGPVEMEIRFKRLEEAQNRSRGGSGWTRVEPYVCRRTLSKISDPWW